MTAAAGGTGQFAVQLAKLAGCHVIGTCSSDEKCKFLKSIGCDHAINLSKTVSTWMFYVCVEILLCYHLVVLVTFFIVFLNIKTHIKILTNFKHVTVLKLNKFDKYKTLLLNI